MNTNWNFLIKTSALFLIILLFKKNCQVLAVDEEANTNLSNEASNISQKSVDQQDDDGINVAKRAWKQLQGGWGKRDNSETDYQLARNWLAQNSLNDDYNDRNLDYDSSYLTQPKQRLTSNNYDEDSGENVEKRAWKQMNAAWGKRVNDWNKFRGEFRNLIVEN